MSENKEGSIRCPFCSSTVTEARAVSDHLFKCLCFVCGLKFFAKRAAEEADR